MKKAFLLGAGLGTRLRPMTETAPKPLVPVFHRPMAMLALDHLASAGIEEVAINTHHLHEEWLKTFPDETYQGLKLHFFHEEVLLETGGGIKNIASFIGDDSILVYNGDILTNIKITDLMAQHLASKKQATLAVRSEGPAQHLAVQDGLVTDIHHKLGVAEGTHQFTGIYCIAASVLSLIPPAEKVSIIPAFLELAKNGELGSYLADEGHWLDLGTREAYLETHGIGAPLIAHPNDPQIHPSAQVHPSAVISNSWIGPNSVIAAGAKINHSILWPGAVVNQNAVISKCIVHTNAPVEGNFEGQDL